MNPLTIYRGLSGPPGLKPPKKSEKSLTGPRAPGPPKSKSRKSLESLEKASKRFRKDFSRLFPDCRGGPGPEAPGDFFSVFFGVLGPEAPRDPCKGSTLFRARNPALI